MKELVSKICMWLLAIAFAIAPCTVQSDEFYHDEDSLLAALGNIKIALDGGAMLHVINGQKLIVSAELVGVVDKLLQCPAAADLVEKALVDGQIIVFPLEPNQPEYPYGSMWQGADIRRIWINPSQDHTFENKVSLLLFEFANATRDKHIQALTTSAEQGLIGREALVKGMERIEYASGVEMLQVYHECLEDQLWATDPDTIASWYTAYEVNAQGKPASFAHLWPRWKILEHADHYRSFWSDHYKKPYCELNPEADECPKMISTKKWT